MNYPKLLSIIVICSILLYSAISYSEFGAPVEFGNATNTTCFIGGDLGIVNCTGDAYFANVYSSFNITLSGNCSGQDSCSLIAYDTELINNCSVDLSCGLITYDNELEYINNCSQRGSCDNVTYLEYDHSDRNITVSVSASNVNRNIPANCSAGYNVFGWDNNLSTTYCTKDLFSGNCSVGNSCSAITYDSELAYISNCSGAICDVTNTGTLDGYEAAALLDDTTISNCSNADCNIGAGNITGELTDAQVSNTLTCSILTDDDTYATTASAETFDENIAFAKNITQGDNDYHCFGNACDSFIYFNGSMLRIKVN